MEILFTLAGSLTSSSRSMNFVAAAVRQNKQLRWPLNLSSPAAMANLFQRAKVIAMAFRLASQGNNPGHGTNVRTQCLATKRTLT